MHTVRAGAVFTVALLTLGCTSLFVATDAYFDDTVVGALDIADSGRFSGFTILDPVAGDYDVFLAGETHGVAENLDYAYKLFQYLYERHDVRTYLAEIGFAAGQQLDAYVQGEGTDLDLAAIMNASRGTYAWTAEWFAFWRRLRLWNANLVPGSRIRVVGIDVEHQVDRGFTYIAERLRGGATDPAIAGVVAELESWTASMDRSASRDLAERALASLSDQSAAWETYLADAFHPVRIAVRSIVRRFEFYDDSSDSETREATIYRNFLDVYEYILGPDERRLAGLWGGIHVSTAPLDGFSSLGSRLQHAPESPVAGRVFALAPYYDESTAMRTVPYRTTPLSSDRLIVRLFAPWATTTATLFYLDGEGSPFRSSAALAPDGRTPTTEVYQAAVFFSRVRASSPLEPPD